MAIFSNRLLFQSSLETSGDDYSNNTTQAASQPKQQVNVSKSTSVSHILTGRNISDVEENCDNCEIEEYDDGTRNMKRTEGTFVSTTLKSKKKLFLQFNILVFI